MSQSKVLVTEDDDDIRNLLLLNLRREGYTVLGVDNGEDALKEVRNFLPDLMLLDLMLPGIDGLEVCRRLKKSGAEFPIILATALGEEHDVVRGLEIGADDYIVKPFSLPVLLARVRRALERNRRETVEKTDVAEIGALKIDSRRHEVSVDGAKVDVSSSEFALLEFLSGHPGWVYTRSQIVEAVHGDKYPVTDRSVDVMVLGLRRKLGEAGNLIETVRGVGYRFVEQ
ncbi:DNA-binding response regulator [Fibrobacterales bacterium]|nr:DNA-binding response regulator [Fibrobacterales bacterium]